MDNASFSMLMKQACLCVHVLDSEWLLKAFKHVHVSNAGLKTKVTVYACTVLVGLWHPLLWFTTERTLWNLLFKEKLLELCMERMNPKSGWMVGELFHEWFVNHFLKYATTTRPLMLLLDGHASYYNPCFIMEAASRAWLSFVCHLTQLMHVNL